MDLTRSYDFFKPENLDGRVHIIGCGAVGSTVAENIARLGVTKISLYDFDTVEPHNIANQMFYATDIGKMKVDAVSEQLKRINPDMPNGADGLKIFKMGYTDQPLDGYVFLAVDNIELRKKICEDNMANSRIKGVFDFRVGLEDAQHYAADWSKAKDVTRILKTMDFTHEEAKSETPVGACNQVLSVAPTVRTIVAAGVANFMRMAKAESWKHIILLNPFNCQINAY